MAEGCRQGRQYRELYFPDVKHSPALTGTRCPLSERGCSVSSGPYPGRMISSPKVNE